MLIKYWIEHYKSFYDRAEFHMQPAPRLQQLSYSVLTEKAGRKKVRGLCSSVVYGPNAAGKTSFLGALEVLKAIVLEGHIRDKERMTNNISVNRLKYIPNIRHFLSGNKTIKPVTLGVEAVTEGLLFSYEVSFQCENLLNSHIERKIVSESLSINEKEIYVRKGNDVQFVNKVPMAYRNGTGNLKGISKFSLQTEPTELFLTGNFKAFYSSSLVKKIREWFDNKLVIVYEAAFVDILPNLTENQSNASFGVINDLAKAIGSSANEMVYINDPDGHPKLCSEFDTPNKRVLIPASQFESLGTRRIISIFPAIAKAFLNGATLLVDELDASIHTMAIISLINVFHDDEINRNHAQLIFNTQNPIYLNRNIFRTDEIKFVDRNDETHCSELYALSDFGTKGSTRAKNTNNYMNNYFVNRYGAIRNIDLSDIFLNILEEQDNK
ncbi:ATP-binding protein [uncultured Acidaminococcus sp.]|uniref:AAA family ATPase n=1 Tax=uncultured Acidaminococcus sp. TaxID=352152 RepID=UPI002941FFCE|nr:ATP-binding protein [uncultured Acidaminococcus sp.]